MGAYKYIQELRRKKESDTMCFLLRVRCWQYCQLSVLHQAPFLPPPTGPKESHRLGYKAKQGYVIYWIRVCCSDRKRPVPKGATYAFSLLLRSELDTTVILIDPFHKAIRRNPDTQWITKPVHKHRDLRSNTLQLHRYH
uniref:Ribosomal protein L15 n=1 Tax=Monodon monoceros TaxID=40151 RepID=A0A8C6C4H5_MONMO